MPPKKKPAPKAAAPSRWVQLVRYLNGPARQFTLMAVTIVCFAGGAWLLWNQVQEHVLGGKEYQVRSSGILIPPLPAWIHRDLKTDVIRSGGLDQNLSLLDPNLAQQVSTAFRLHPWVAEVRHVSIEHPGTVRVDLVYRRPVAVVQTASGGTIPVDEQGIVLPQGDFSPTEIKSYPQVSNIMTEPRGSVGTVWGDPRVLSAATLARLLLDDWQKLQLHQIAPMLVRQIHANQEPPLEIYTVGGAQIVWGSPVGSEKGDEMPADQKLAKLREYAEKHQSLDQPTSRQVFYLNSGELRVTPAGVKEAAP